NLPRHLLVLRALVAKGQDEGVIAAMPSPQAIGFCMGSLAMPILAGGAAIDSGLIAPATRKMLQASLLTNEAIDQRIDLALKALAAAAPARSRTTRTRRKS